jgi:Glycosyltransferase family 87
VIIVVATALALGLRLYWLTRPGMLFGAPEYDDGEYLGSAIRLASGALPYRDFAFVMPPGITLLMAPLGLLAKATSTATAMASARILVACVGAASVAVAGLLVRHRGVLVTSVTCGLLAVFPEAVKASSTLFLEPWLVLLCLLGAMCLFDGDHLTGSRRRLIWGGVCIGFAAAVKVWAVFPAVVLLGLLLWSPGPRRAAQYLGGAVAGFLVPVIPFAVIAPRAFLDNVIVAQLHQTDVSRVAGTVRLFHLLGLAGSSAGRNAILLVAAVTCGFVVLCTIGAWFGLRSAPPALDWFALGTTALIGLAFMVPMEFAPHYAAFFAPFLALSIALPAARLAARWDERPPAKPSVGRRARIVAPLLAAGAAAAVTVMAVVSVNRESSLRALTPAAYLERAIPAGACVITDNSSFTIVSNRFVSSVPGCTRMVDATGTDMSLGDGRNGLTGASRYAAVQSVWLSAFHHAQYVFMSCGPPRSRGCDRRIPWTPAVWAYFTHRFRRVSGGPGFLYGRDIAPRTERQSSRAGSRGRAGG